MFTQNKEQLRNTYQIAWDKHKKNQVAKLNLENQITALEQQIIDITILHPEYHSIFEKNPDSTYNIKHHPTNPFLHFGLHLAIREQMQLNLPHGITNIYNKLCLQEQSIHQAEHKMLEVLEQHLFNAQFNPQNINEIYYIQHLTKLLK